MDLCSAYGRCGACSKLDIDYENQLKEKEDKVLKIFENLKLSPKRYHGIIGSPEIYAYRNKMEYTFGNEAKDAPLIVGFRGRKKKFDVFYTPDCKLVDDDFNKIVVCTKEFFSSRDYTFRNYRKHTGYLRHLSVRKGINTNEILINIATDFTDENDGDIQLWAEELKNLKLNGKIVSILHSKTTSKGNVLKADKLEVIFGDMFFHEKVLDLSFKVGPFSFFQTNTHGAEVLYSTAMKYVENADVAYDLYSGTGTIASLLSKYVKKVYAVELVEEAVKMAKLNAEMNNINNVEFLCGDVKDKIKELPKPDFVVFDPPRAGLNPKVISFIKRQSFKKIIYVSCNPETLAQDLKALENFYSIEDLHIVDMFPHTPHVESVCLLVKK
ncbi:23S rRNA (uracil-5-)-methyltransferase RumA [Tepiditoga spiralis]|uniref:23S rRNA (Uracil-5-)-methyltransferase RumA n=1 Tax=Tepiditoga spiralis TaxID=2108365 RepID=A0A7G1G1Q5_9BACT|nr:23S rRNA (uracil(1939)-C(5))-methyltransferase RlmD [Tepiditoga spiralis]BBE30160.1 23S rRNA (uracil-5-)-methyltransferase RumA [Tepiditoga spiralis]